MATEVLVPPLGQTVDTLTIVSWYKQEGETVTQGEPLYVVETDKAALDVEAPASGVLRGVTAKPGDEVKVLSAIAVIGEAEAISSSASTRLFVSPRARRLAESEGVPLAAVKPTGPEGAIIERDVRAYMEGAGVRSQESGAKGQGAGDAAETPEGQRSITPVARRMAEEAGLDLGAVSGTGPRGQIVREDVARALAAAAPATPAEPVEAPFTTVARATAAEPVEAPCMAPEPAESIPLAGIRGLIAERMAASHSQTAPVTLTAEADATALVELRKQLAADGVAVSYNDLLLYVLARALRQHPRLNASLDGETIRVWRRIDIGLAVDAERGLRVPVVRDVASKGLAQLAAETAALAARARAGQCTPAELTGGTFTLTNLGMFGIDAFTPLINLPETAILGVGRIKARPAVVGDQIVARQTVWLSLTFDHRLVDGGPAARFLQRVVQLVEKPHLLMA